MRGVTCGSIQSLRNSVILGPKACFHGGVSVCGGARAPFQICCLSNEHGGPLAMTHCWLHVEGGGVRFAHDIQVLRLILKKRVAFAWMFNIHNDGVIHCDLSLLNINFHNQLDKTLSIGLCNWGIRRSG